jgi:pimeloyl-ACP methyl ester carboxylesterase
LREAADALAARILQLSDVVHVVAHSLGGLVACEAYAAHENLPPGRLVLLGSPVRGSRAAREVAARWYGPVMLGSLAIAELARERDCVWQSSREVGVIAGSLSVGIGRVFAELPQLNDGTVCVDETEMPGATDQLVLDVTHTGMLLSRPVADAAIGFLRDGRFPHKGA